ncbi:MAG: hypothetical protein H7836_10400 [Magnetococcus sp. YQC-3]
MLIFADRVKEMALVTGTGAYSLNGFVPGFNAFSAGIGVGNTCYYCAELGTAWEVGVGTVSTSPDAISRDRILSSSNSGSAVVWPVGSTVNVFCVAPAEIATLMASGRTITTTGELKSAIGVARWYPPINLFFSAWEAWVGEAPGGTPVQFTLKKNGVSIGSGTIAASAVRMAKTALAFSVTTSDYLTLDITGVGVGPKGSDLVVRLIP